MKAVGLSVFDLGAAVCGFEDLTWSLWVRLLFDLESLFLQRFNDDVLEAVKSEGSGSGVIKFDDGLDRLAMSLVIINIAYS